MNRFNLTFRGEIVDGHDPAQVRARLAQVLAIEDPTLLQRCFSGDPVVLSRNLGRKEGAELYARLRRLGIHVELIKIGERGDLHAGEKQGAQVSLASTPYSPDNLRASPGHAGPPGKKPPPATAPSHAGARAPSPAPATPPETAAVQVAAQARAVVASAASGTPVPTKSTSQPITRRADLAVNTGRQTEKATLLKAKEKELQKLLREKEKEDVRRARNSERARQKAELAEQKRKKQAEAAERKAKQKKLEAEAAAKRQAERELEQARAAARKAEEQAERERQQALERERLAARRAEQEELEQARLEEKRRLAAEKAARRQEEKRKSEEVADRLRAENARRKRELAEAATRQKAEEARKKAEEQAAEAEQRAQRRAMEEQPIQRAAVELAQKPSLKPVDARVRTRLEMPSMQRRSGQDARRRKQQSGEPNLYSLSAFRNTPAIRARAGQSRRIMRLALRVAAISLSAALILIAGKLGLSTPQVPVGAGAIAVGPEGQPLLLAGNHLLLHDRAGVGVSRLTLDDLGLAALQGPMAFTATGELLAPGRLAEMQESADSGAPAALLRCALAELRCEVFSAALAGTAISALTVNPLDGNLFIADGGAGQLLKVSPQGELLARAAVELPAQPALRLDSGLLLVTSAEGPVIDIYRYEDEAFGTQLDEALLLPPAGDAGKFTGVRDFLRSGGYWWALLQQAGKDRMSLYRFDPGWAFMDTPSLTPGSRPTQLISWGNRTLVADPGRIPIQRFNSNGAAETPLVSDALTELRIGQVRRENLIQLVWRIALALLLLAAAASLFLGWLHRARSMVYTSCHEEGAVPIDELAGRMDWIEQVPERGPSLGRRGIAYAVLVTVLVVAGIVLGISSLQLSALLLALAGPAIALLLLHRSDPGHIGLAGDQLLLVDHEGMYHLGSGSRIHYRGRFLMIDDVTVFTGTRLLPAFDNNGIEERIAPIAAAGVRVDPTIVTVKLLQGRHPLALGAVAIAATSATAIALLSLQGIF